MSETLILLFAFVIIAVASNQISKLFTKIHLPIITGILLIGIVSGPFILQMVPTGIHIKLAFINDISLAFIAFAAGSELYLKELRSRIRQITWITFGQLIITFCMSSIIIYYLANQIPFMVDLPENAKLAISILIGTIFVARSPSSAIAVINEMRAKGPFTSTALGVTVVKDVLVIILFTIVFASSKSMINNELIDSIFAITLLFELVVSFVLGYFLGQLLSRIMMLKLEQNFKSIIIVLTGYLVYVFAHYVEIYSMEYFGHGFFLEPLLICIIGGFVVANFTSFRFEFLSIMEKVGPIIYVAFFTLTGLSLSIDLLLEVWQMALFFFLIRLISIMLGSLIGGSLAGDSMKFNLIGWMPYVTQAGVGLGLATIVAKEYPAWGEEFLTLIIAVIVINQIVGPPLFKWAINLVDEAHTKADSKDGEDMHDAIIFGYENQSIALALQLVSQGWHVKIATRLSNTKPIDGVEVAHIKALDDKAFKQLDCEKANTIVTMLSDDDNLIIANNAYEALGTKNLIVKLNDRLNAEKFQQLDAKIVEPNTAMVSLLDHFVRSPQATALLLGMEEGQDSIDVEITAQEIHGMALRNLRFPQDAIILSIHRKGSALVCHGFTRLRLGDVVTVVGSRESLEKVSFKLAN
ncbi:MAG: cation:proton antiporter [Flavobacteriales bacterium]|jgi:Trk K+ transport system NAD-binding subunit/Kef-type K+ transport system membrane component KefB|nr:cation:proton antiporter [Flavobacteriales bacterium]